MESKKIKILAIDDNKDNLVSLKALIKDEFPDAIIFTALNGIKGIELAAKENPDVILLDIVMPDMDGYEVCQKLKTDDLLRDIPVVFITAIKGDKESRIRALECGGDAFLAKPIDESELIAQIRAMVKIRNANIFKHNEKERLEELVEERTHELNKTQEETLRLLDEVKKENEERKKAEQEATKAKEKAEESDRLKTAFLNNMSHEIRTPMNGILGFARLLRKTNLTSEKQQNFIEIIGKCGERMLDTINNIIDISKIEAGLMSVYISESNINMQIEFLYEFFTPIAKNKGVQLSFDNGLPSNEAIIKTDSGKINSILTNLVNNAIKYTDEGSIEFGYVLKSDSEPGSTEPSRSAELEFFVKDTGIGIPKDRLDEIFERFIQADIEDKHAFQGSGLGLTISKSYVEMLDGKIWVESEEGLGSIFYFTIPYIVDSEDKNVINNAVPADDNEVKIKKPENISYRRR